MNDLDVACRLSTVECGGKALGEIGLIEASRSGDLKHDGLGLGVKYCAQFFYVIRI